MTFNEELKEAAKAGSCFFEDRIQKSIHAVGFKAGAAWEHKRTQVLVEALEMAENDLCVIHDVLIVNQPTREDLKALRAAIKDVGKVLKEYEEKE